MSSSRHSVGPYINYRRVAGDVGMPREYWYWQGHLGTAPASMRMRRRVRRHGAHGVVNASTDVIKRAERA
jgi:hypothetical protein